MTGRALHDRVALVAGSSGSLAAAATTALRDAGARVVSDEDGNAAAVDRVVDAHGRIDLLVNVSESLPGEPFGSVDLADLAAAVDATLTRTFERCQHAGRSMLAGSGGTIVNLVEGATGGEGVATAAALRGGLIGMTKVLGTEWVRRGIRVVAVSVGVDPATGGPVDAERVGALVTYVCSDAASFITGSHLRAGEDVRGVKSA